MGHPCCSVHDCKQPLATKKGEHFCAKHEYLKEYCCARVDGLDCSNKRNPGHKTCSLPDHRCLERLRDMKVHQSIFSLKQRVARVDTRRARDVSMLQDQLKGDNEVVINPLCAGKLCAGNQQARGFFGRQCTHNEELCVLSCGIVAGRATLYGSEAPNGVVVGGLHILELSQC
jgi:hypothetical protein